MQFTNANGNQAPNGVTVGGVTHTLTYDGENRLTKVMNGSTTIATFVYDGDGQRVKSTLNGVTTTFVGNYYEWTGSSTTIKKYYYAGSQRVAMRTGSSTLNFLLGDHLGSTSVTTSATGTSPKYQLYKPFGEVRYTSSALPTKYTFTGQYSNVSDFGLMYYNARWYDPYLNRWVQPDTIIPDYYNPTDFDRYQYVRSNPLRYNDPSGHIPACDKDDWACQYHWDEPVAEDWLMDDTETLGDVAIETIATILFEPLDWWAMAEDCYNGRCSPWMLMGLLPFIPGSVGDDIGEGLIRLVRTDQIGTSQPFKLRKGEDGLSVFEGVSPEEVLNYFPGNEVPNSTVIIPKDKLPLGTEVISKLDPSLPQRLSEAHRILARPEGWSIDRFAKALKEIIGWK